MEKKYTASEVRERAKTFGAGDIYCMLHAYADLLEAQEKAVPVAWRTRGACMAETVYTEWMPDEPNVAAWEPLYTHPAAQPRVPECQHEWVSGDNQYVKNAEVCLKCNTIRAAQESGR